MRSAIIVFPGSNCDSDLQKAVSEVTNEPPFMVWHESTKLPSRLDILFLPGGFSFGDYLRCGAMAANSPIMDEVIKFAIRGGYILGICNGFQILTESGLLKGCLLRNSSLNFICKNQRLYVVSKDSIFTKGFKVNQNIKLPIAHQDGNYHVTKKDLNFLEAENLIAFRYINNPNGSTSDIAGILSSNRRVLGMMPHPERAIASKSALGNRSLIFKSILDSFK